LLPSVDRRIDDVQYENYNIPTLKYGHRVLVLKDRYVEHGTAYVFTEADYVNARVEQTFYTPEVTLLVFPQFLRHISQRSLMSAFELKEW